MKVEREQSSLVWRNSPQKSSQGQSADVTAAQASGRFSPPDAQTLSPNDSASSPAPKTSQAPSIPGKNAKNGAGEGKYSPRDLAVINELKTADREVRDHEAAHVAAGGNYVRGGANFTYTTGPDGKRYATGGEVTIDTSPVPNDPQATVTKMETVRRAALAPAEPSGQDRQVASSAAREEGAAQLELSAKSRETQ
ncbi:MAG TPA: putative metalloprotease CJM1_0395 family protein [Candidatus Ozemobacteraceae bacterium]|nr:putative metalloprotease CJM1_0395 family protein [Candidatus Ozemobacteraceae bacterium]